MHNGGPLEGGHCIILIHSSESVPLPWSTQEELVQLSWSFGGRTFHNIGTLEGWYSIILVHSMESFHNRGPREESHSIILVHWSGSLP